MNQKKNIPIQQRNDLYRIQLGRTLSNLYKVLENLLRCTERMKLTREVLGRIMEFFNFVFLQFIIEDSQKLFCAFIQKRYKTLTVVRPVLSVPHHEAKLQSLSIS